MSGVNSEGVRVKGLERGSHFSPFPTVQQVSALQTLSNFVNNTNRVRRRILDTVFTVILHKTVFHL